MFKSSFPFFQKLLSALHAWIALLTLLVFASSSYAQFRVEVSGVGLTQLPIAIASFKGDDVAPQKIASIVIADLERSGQFRSVDTAGVLLDEVSRPDMSVWRQKKC